MMECLAGLVCDSHIAVATRGMEDGREVVEFRSFSSISTFAHAFPCFLWHYASRNVVSMRCIIRVGGSDFSLPRRMQSSSHSAAGRTVLAGAP